MKFNIGVFYHKMLSNFSVYLYHRILTTTVCKSLIGFCVRLEHKLLNKVKKFVDTVFTGTYKTYI